MTDLPKLDVAERRRSPATMPGYHAGRPPCNKGSPTWPTPPAGPRCPWRDGSSSRRCSGAAQPATGQREPRLLDPAVAFARVPGHLPSHTPRARSRVVVTAQAGLILLVQAPGGP
jgi:hypothetical protein